MRHSLLALIILFSISCGSENGTSVSNSENNITGMSKFVPPHFKEMELEDHVFPSSIYNKIDEFKSLLIEYRKLEFENRMDNELNEKYNIAIETLINETAQDYVTPMSQSVLQDYINPLREVFAEIESAGDVESYNKAIGEGEKYLNNFRELFPEN